MIRSSVAESFCSHSEFQNALFMLVTWCGPCLLLDETVDSSLIHNNMEFEIVARSEPAEH